MGWALKKTSSMNASGSVSLAEVDNTVSELGRTIQIREELRPQKGGMRLTKLSRAAPRTGEHLLGIYAMSARARETRISEPRDSTGQQAREWTSEVTYRVAAAGTDLSA